MAEMEVIFSLCPVEAHAKRHVALPMKDLLLCVCSIKHLFWDFNVKTFCASFT